MSRKQLFALFLCSLVIWTTGSGLIPLLPVYATQMGAAPAVVVTTKRGSVDSATYSMGNT